MTLCGNICFDIHPVFMDKQPTNINTLRAYTFPNDSESILYVMFVKFKNNIQDPYKIHLDSVFLTTEQCLGGWGMCKKVTATSVIVHSIIMYTPVA